MSVDMKGAAWGAVAAGGRSARAGGGAGGGLVLVSTNGMVPESVSVMAPGGQNDQVAELHHKHFPNSPELAP